METIGGRWAVVRLSRPGGPSVARLTAFQTHSAAIELLSEWRRSSDNPRLLGIATCAHCGSSDAGCEVCGPGRLPNPEPPGDPAQSARADSM